MKKIPLPPEASQLLESLRSIGYSAEAAVADLIDNSITAEAGVVEIRFPAGTPSHLAVLDDGKGMDADALIAAMRHGSSRSSDHRPENDLGRFGLGLKTASLSQCRCLTVVSKRDGKLTACRWDLDFVKDCNKWLLLQLDKSELESLPYIDELRARKHGTMVLWTQLDRLAAGDKGDGAVVSARIDAVRRHLSLVFHRYLSGEVSFSSLRILINRAEVDPVDPFLISKKSSQKTPLESFYIEGVPIHLMGFTLPHISKLRPDEIEVAGGGEGLRRQQGFYVYRNYRLIVWGTWFRLMRQEELTKLTRVRIDIPNSLDHLWTLDIKKATAVPPEQVKEQLKALIPKLCEGSLGTQTHRAKGQTTGKFQRIWRREETREGAVQYRIDRQHVVVDSMLGALDDVERRSVLQVLRAVEESFPGEAFYNDRAAERTGFFGSSVTDDESKAYFEDLARQLMGELADQPLVQERILGLLATVEPFSRNPELAEQIAERLRHEHGLG
jgi:Histidine kinase-, DNA gyrase B-, and HSP90-like ATPase